MLSLVIASIFLNGVNIDGLRGQSFEKCRTVKVDEKGDVHLDCPAYQVEQAPTPAAAPAQPVAPPPAAAAAQASKVTDLYYLIAEQSAECAALVDVEVFLNGGRLRSLKAAESQSGIDITTKMKPGRNVFMVMVAKKAGAIQAVAGRPVKCGKVMIGTGTEAAGNKAVVEKVIRDQQLEVPPANDFAYELVVEAK